MGMECRHEGYHSIASRYDRRRGVLIFFWVCEQCGCRLGEAGRQNYRPTFNPHPSKRIARSRPLNAREGGEPPGQSPRRVLLRSKRADSLPSS